MFLRYVLLAVVIASSQMYAEQGIARAVKSEGGLVIYWEQNSSDAGANQVEIFDEHGHGISKLNVLRPVPDAKRVSIDDVSARGDLIAVGAVYVNKQGSRQIPNAGALLLFDFSGQMLSAITMDTTHAITRLAVDDRSNIWTLTDGAGVGVDPATVPMVVEYSNKGEIQKELLTHKMFPFHASDTRQDALIGPAAMGYEDGVVWFWLPGSTDLVTVSTSDYKVSIMKPGLPMTGNHAYPLAIKREPSGSLVAQLGQENGAGGRELAYYRWSASEWTRFKPGSCDGQVLIGTSAQGQIFIPHEIEHTSTCRFRNGQ